MNRQSLDIYDEMPSAMKKYISNYGWHFNKKMCMYACKQMRNKQGEKIPVADKEQVEMVLAKYNVKLKNDVLYDKVYVYNMAVADYLHSSILDEPRLAQFVADYVDNYDECSDATFRKYVACCIGNGEPIEWEDML